MDRASLLSLVKELYHAPDASTVETIVKQNMEHHLGLTSDNRLVLSESKLPGAIVMVHGIIKVLEHRLCNKPTIDVLDTRFDCEHYMEVLCGTTRRLEFLKSRCGLLPCFEYWGMLEVVEDEGNNILEEINKLLTSKRSRGGQVLPKPGTNNSKNDDAAYSVLRVSAAFIRVWWRRSRQEQEEEEEEGNRRVFYANILDLVTEMDPWFRYINQEDKINGMTIRGWISTFLSKCTLSLIDEREELYEPVQFCEQAFKQFGEAASMNDKMLEFAQGICRSFFSKKDDQYFHKSQILVCVLKNMAIECKKHAEEQTLSIFMELVCYCTIEYGEASADECITLGSFFHTLAEKYFFQACFSNVRMIMEHCALALVVSYPGSYKRWPNPKFSDAVSIDDILTQLELHLEEFNNMELKTHAKFPAFLCGRMTTFILSNYMEMILMDENSRNLPVMGDFLGHFLELGVSASCKSESPEDMIQVVKLAVTSFTLLLITKQDTKGFLEKLMKDGKFQTPALKKFYQYLRIVYQPLYKSGKVDQAIETLQICCEALWARVSLFCDMVSVTEYEVRSNFFSDDSIVDIVNKATEDSVLLLKIIHQHHTQDVDRQDSTLKCLIDKWVLAQEKFQILIPTALITEWVKELQTYRQMQNLDSQFLKRMESHIQDSIPRINSRKHIFDRSNCLIKCGMRLASHGDKGLLDCIKYITEAVNLLIQCSKGDLIVLSGDDFHRLLPKAYFLRSLYKRLAYPKQKEYTEDINSGLKLYRKKDSKFSETECTLFFWILDMLSLDANMELQCEVYEIMIKSFGGNLKEFLGIALQSGNLHHPLCSTPLNIAFLDMVHKYSSWSTTDVSFWRTCVTSKSLEAGTHQSLSVLPTLSYLEPDDDTLAAKAQETIKEVKLAALSLISSVSECKNLFAAARHYYNLAEVMITKGLLSEALTYANEAYRLRKELLSECFIIEWKGGTIKKDKYVCKTFNMHPSRLSSLGTYCLGTNVYVPTPWNLLRGHLESSLQTGTLHSMIGDSSVATDMLYYGKAISSVQNLPVFLAEFSIALGNLYCKQKRWRSATRELESAQKSLEACSPNLCKKCIYFLQVKLDLVAGDLKLSILKNKGEDALKMAKELFKKAKSNLENNEWLNSVSRPEREIPTEKNPVLCHSKAAYAGSNEECWHCQNSIVEKSSSLEDLTNLQWEIIRRRYMLQVFTKLAKCAKLEKDINEERRFLIAGIYVLVGRSTFQKPELSASFIEELVGKNVVAEALGAEQASILYKICCFSLRHEDSSETAILSRENVVCGLKMAFVLSREVPKVHEKVAQILAVMYASSSNDVTLSKLKRVSAIRSAAFFHQCSIGSHFNTRFLSLDQNQLEVDGSHDRLRHILAPCSVKELEESITDFFLCLPSLSETILCISMLSEKSYGILHKFLPESPYSAWLMISRFHLKIGPVVVILPVNKTLTDFPYTKETVVRDWTCPWAGTKFDQVAPVLRLVLEEDYKLTVSEQSPSEIIQNRKKLDNILRGLLRDLENTWLGQWKYLLLGECSGCDDLDDNVDKITDDYRSLNSVFEEDHDCLEKIKSNYGCYMGTSGGKINKSVKEKLGDTIEKKCRNPVVIVLHPSAQMIPLESVPILEKEEVYRMPSFGSILRSVLKNGNPSKDKTVDPRDCCYFIAPDAEEELTELIKCLKEWSENFYFEGKAGILVKMGVNELKEVLEARDLFIYAGHNDGRQYISGNEIRKVNNCCAAILMGCNSGYLFSKYHVMDSGTLDYLLAGSPVVVANLWFVRSAGMESFTKTLFETWIKTTSSKLVKCKRKSKKRKRTGMSLCKHGFNLGSSMAKAREACNLRYIEGATTVIYGTPTRIAVSN